VGLSGFGLFLAERAIDLVAQRLGQVRHDRALCTQASTGMPGTSFWPNALLPESGT
jgi:hypothetical protein